MTDPRILEVMIASDDHRMLSANAEAWWLVQNDVFVPFESFLTEESKQSFLQHLGAADPVWFLVCFSREPEIAYLTRIEPNASAGSEATIRILLTRLDELMDAFLRQGDLISTYDAMLSFKDDLYFEYFPEEDQITLYNTRQTHYAGGKMPLDAFREQLEACGDEEAGADIAAWMEHLRKKTPRFRLKIGCNLINREDEGIRSVSVRGAMIHHRNSSVSIAGIVHPVRVRTSEDHEVTYDTLTGAVSREHIVRIARDRIDRLKAKGAALAILDIDYFKHINDNFGHQYGDEILRRVAAVMQEEIKSAGMIGRIGGDEFMLLFWHVSGETELRAYLRSIKSVIAATFEEVTVSVGGAVYPDAAACYSDLFMVADYCLYLAKEKGRNRYIIHTLAKHPDVEGIRSLQTEGDRNLIKGRDDLPLGEVLVQMQFLVRYGKKPAADALLNEFAARANIPLITLWRREDRSLVAAGGREKSNAEILQDYLRGNAPDDLWIPRYVINGMCIVNTVNKPEEGFPEVRAALTERGIGSYIYIPFDDDGGIPMALIFAVFNRKVFWNQQQYMHFRLFADLMARGRFGADAP